jgi:hypothetical protein
MDLSNAEVQHLAEADRREVDPPIEVQMATWSKAGQLDWWVKERLPVLLPRGVQPHVLSAAI